MQRLLCTQYIKSIIIIITVAILFSSCHCNDSTVSRCEPIPLAWMVHHCTISSHSGCGSVIFYGTTITVKFEETVQEMLVFDWIAFVSKAQEQGEDTMSCILQCMIMLFVQCYVVHVQCRII